MPLWQIEPDARSLAPASAAHRREILVTSPTSSVTPDAWSARRAAQQEVHFAAQAVPERGVEERGREGAGAGRHPQPLRPGGVSDQTDDGEEQADGLGEAWRRRVLELGG